MAMPAVPPVEKEKEGAQPKRKYHDFCSDVKGYLLICLIFYIVLQDLVNVRGGIFR
jgi:predicted cobalt transporter CbtA